MMLHNANNANWVKQQQRKVQQLATIVTLVNLAVVVVFAWHAQRGFIKIPKGKRSAEKSVLPLENYPTKNGLGVNCHRGEPAKWANT